LGVAIVPELSKPPDRIRVERDSKGFRTNIRWHDSLTSINWPLIFNTDHSTLSFP
jgi:hypothetical protein